MRYIAELVSVMAGLSVMAKMTISYVNKQRAKETIKTAFFTGGEMDGKKKQLKELPVLITHGEEVYRREHDDGRTALYTFAADLHVDDVSTVEV